jgi:hypothetical protein
LLDAIGDLVGSHFDLDVVLPASVTSELRRDLEAAGAAVHGWRPDLPLLVSAAQATSGVRILLVNQREGAETIRAFLRDMGLPEDGVLLDQSGLVSTFLDVAGLPTTFAFNARGEMVDLHLGEISAAGLNAMIQKVR